MRDAEIRSIQAYVTYDVEKIPGFQGQCVIPGIPGKTQLQEEESLKIESEINEKLKHLRLNFHSPLKIPYFRAILSFIDGLLWIGDKISTGGAINVVWRQNKRGFSNLKVSGSKKVWSKNGELNLEKKVLFKTKVKKNYLECFGD